MPEHALVSWDSVEREELNPLLARQIISGSRVMISRIYLKKDCVIPPHHHESEQLSYVLEGALVFRLEDAGTVREVTVRPGEVLVIPSNMVHSAVAIEDTFDIDVFSPIREDWLNKSDQYLRG